MPKRKSCHRVFSRAFKVGIVRRMLAGESVSALARELKATRKDLYVWRDRFLAGGPEALRGRGRPPKAEAASLVASGAKAQAAVPDTPAAELEEARKRIAELERKVGQQQVDLDFFRQALQRVRGARRPSAEPGVTGSTRSSKR
jgi:transposase